MLAASRKGFAVLLPFVLFFAVFAGAQTAYQPKFAGDPAHSDSEAGALGYMRTVLRAQKEFKKKHNAYATSLTDLVHSGSFTKRMAKTDRGDYQVGFRGKKDGYILLMTPQQLDAEHRSFFADDSGAIHGDQDKPADTSSPVVVRLGR